MGFEIMIEIEAGGTSSKVNQFDEDGKVGAQISGRRHLRLLQPAQRRRLLRRRASRGMVDRACRPRPLDGRSLGERRCARNHRHHRPHLPAGQRQLHPVERRLLHPRHHRSVLRHDAGPTSAIPRRTTRAAPSWCAMTARAGTASSTRRRSPRPATTGARMIRYAGEFTGFRIAGTVGYERVTDRGDAGDRRSDRLPRSPGAGRTSRSGALLSRSCTCRPACSCRATTTTADFDATAHRCGERLLGRQWRRHAEASRSVDGPGRYLRRTGSATATRRSTASTAWPPTGVRQCGRTCRDNCNGWLPGRELVCIRHRRLHGRQRCDWHRADGLGSRHRAELRCRRDRHLSRLPAHGC